jgi:Double-GTPase 2
MDGSDGLGCMLVAIGYLLAGLLLCLAAVPVAVIVALVFTGYAIYLYLRGVAAALGVGPDDRTVKLPEPPTRHEDGRDPAPPHYLYGPALADLAQTIREGRDRPYRALLSLLTKIKDRFFDWSEPNPLAWAFGGCLWLGLVLGALLSVLTVALLALWQLLFWSMLAGAAYGLIQALRGLDALNLWVRGIWMFCSSTCHRKVLFPIYACPYCQRKHHDVRPGRYGVFTRVCVCGTRMPTLLLFGSSQLKAFCPRCGDSMGDRAGNAPEFVLPMLGASTSGKTRMMLAIVRSLQERDGLTAEFADEVSRSIYEKYAPALSHGTDTWKTVPIRDTPLRAYRLHLTAHHGGRRLMHLFDPPGEIIETFENMQAQGYLTAARTFVLVLDPLTIDAVWWSFDDARREELARYRSGMSADHVFAQVLQNIEALGVQPKKARLVVALTKHDLVRGLVAGGNSDAVTAWLESPKIGLDNMVRSMCHAFGEVRFFRTSAWIEDGMVDTGIVSLTSWILDREGLKRTGLPEEDL